MGYIKESKKEHAFNTISKDVKGGNISKPLFFYGKEKYLIQWAVDLIINKMIQKSSIDLDLSIIDENSASLDQIKETCETFPMLSQKRVVVLKDYKWINESFISYLNEIPETCQLIITNNEIDKKNKNFKELLKVTSEYEFEKLDEPDLKKYIEKRLKASNKRIRTIYLNQLIQSTGYFDKDTQYTIFNLENDLKKIVAHSDNEEISLEDIEASISGNVELNIFNMIDAMSSNKKDEAFRLLHNIISSGEKIYYVLAVIIGQMETILEVKELREEGHSIDSMKKILGIHEFRIKKAMIFSEKFSKLNLKKILISLYEVDRNIKNGFLEGEISLEIIIARM